jgi:hypothetical protein
MVTEPRIKRLRELIAEIELLPVSQDRDRLLSEFRSRAVDIDTGVTPRAILPLRAIPEKRRPRRHSAPRGRRAIPSPPVPAIDAGHPGRAASHSQDVNERVCVDERLSLDDALRLSAHQVQKHGNRAVAPWAGGLRG